MISSRDQHPTHLPIPKPVTLRQVFEANRCTGTGYIGVPKLVFKSVRLLIEKGTGTLCKRSDPHPIESLWY